MLIELSVENGKLGFYKKYWYDLDYYSSLTCEFTSSLATWGFQMHIFCWSSKKFSSNTGICQYLEHDVKASSVFSLWVRYGFFSSFFLHFLKGGYNYFVGFKIYSVQIVCQNSFENIDRRDQFLFTISKSVGDRRISEFHLDSPTARTREDGFMSDCEGKWPWSWHTLTRQAHARQVSQKGYVYLDWKFNITGAGLHNCCHVIKLQIRWAACAG